MQEVLKTDQKGRLEAVLREGGFDDITDHDLPAAFLKRRDGDVPVTVDIEVTAAPSVDEVELLRILGRPRFA